MTMFLVAEVVLYILLVKWQCLKPLQPAHTHWLVTLYDYVRVHTLCTNSSVVKPYD